MLPALPFTNTGLPTERLVCGWITWPVGVETARLLGLSLGPTNEPIVRAVSYTHLESEDPKKDINIYINSPGGSVTAGMAIYDTMQFIKPDVRTLCIGQACSMGAFLLAGGAAGKRAALPNARVMIHQPLGGFRGQASDIQIHAQEILKIKQTLNERLAFHLSLIHI